MTEGCAEENGTGVRVSINPIWTAQLTACGSLIMYVRKIIFAPPSYSRSQNELAYVTKHTLRLSRIFEKQAGSSLIAKRILSRDQNASGVSIRLIEWRAYRTILSSTNNGHAQHATIFSLVFESTRYK